MKKPKFSWRQVGKSAVNIAILLAIFIIGVNVGNGNIDFHKANGPSSSLPNELDYTEVNEVYKSLKANYDGKVTEEQLEDGLKHGLAEATKDPYTVYFNTKEAKEFNDDLNNTFSGIGAQLGQDKEGNVEIIAPIDGFPAQKAGLKAHDIIADINGESTSGMSVDEAVSKIRGKAGTQVKLKVIRNRSQALDFTITRENINIPSVETKTLNGNIGYIQISQFSPDTAELVKKAAEQFKQQNVKGIIVDLRNNPGGLLDSSVKISSLWLPRGTKVLDEKQGNKVINSDYSEGGDVLKGVPTVVLVNGGSASASEIMAGALHDNKAAYVIGEKTYGKGVVQQLINLKDGSQLKVTVASWFRPNGQNINKKGISPDQQVKLDPNSVKDDTDNQLQAAEAYILQR